VRVIEIPLGMLIGFLLWFFLRYGFGGFYTVGPSERAVLTSFGRANRIPGQTTLNDPVSAALRADERDRYAYPQVRVIAPGVYWKLPWQRVHKVSVATRTLSIAFDPEVPDANRGGQVLEAVTKDQLNIGLSGQLRYGICERNLYAYLFGVKHSLAHVMGYFTSILRDRIANFTAPAAPADPGADVVQTISINDLRRHLRGLNENMNVECAAAAARYGITFALRAYLRNAGLGLLRKARQLVLTRDMKEAP
jgi:regulator of protease activity HflC (stomatin/prohibitin superfamily)